MLHRLIGRQVHIRCASFPWQWAVGMSSEWLMDTVLAADGYWSPALQLLQRPLFERAKQPRILPSDRAGPAALRTQAAHRLGAVKTPRLREPNPSHDSLPVESHHDAAC